MRISDWSSDVCSSDLFMAPFLIRVHGLSVEDAGLLLALTYGVGGMIGMPLGGVITDAIRKRRPGRELGTFGIVNIVRSEARRVGKECVRTCSTRGSPYP